jgi:hypothetical protein
VDPPFPGREAALAPSFSMMPAHNESTKDKQVSQVNATEIFVLFIDLTSVTLFKSNGPGKQDGHFPLASPVPKPPRTAQVAEVATFR